MIIKVFLTVAAVWLIQGVFEFFAGEWWQFALSVFSLIPLFLAYSIYHKNCAE